MSSGFQPRIRLDSVSPADHQRELWPNYHTVSSVIVKFWFHDEGYEFVNYIFPSIVLCLCILKRYIEK